MGGAADRVVADPEGKKLTFLVEADWHLHAVAAGPGPVQGRQYAIRRQDARPRGECAPGLSEPVAHLAHFGQAIRDEHDLAQFAIVDSSPVVGIDQRDRSGRNHRVGVESARSRRRPVEGGHNVNSGPRPVQGDPSEQLQSSRRPSARRQIRDRDHLVRLRDLRIGCVVVVERGMARTQARLENLLDIPADCGQPIFDLLPHG